MSVQTHLQLLKVYFAFSNQVATLLCTSKQAHNYANRDFTSLSTSCYLSKFHFFEKWRDYLTEIARDIKIYVKKYSIKKVIVSHKSVSS